MEILYSKNFEKAFSKLPRRQQEKVDEIITLFRQNPHNPRLRNHALHGKQKGQRSIEAGGDLRLVFIEKDNYMIVRFLTVGTHSQVY